MVISLNYCSQNGGNLFRAPYYNGNSNIGPRIIGNLDQYPYKYISIYTTMIHAFHVAPYRSENPGSPSLGIFSPGSLQASGPGQDPGSMVWG